MAFALADVIPWGRSYAEYIDMFHLSVGDLRRRILGCGDGPASFNAGVAAGGGRIRSIDPLYGCHADEIRERIRQVVPTVIEQVRENVDAFVWRSISSIEELERVRLCAMDAFLADYESATARTRYVDGMLPELPFASGEFDLALCSHLLFLYSEHYSRDFHQQSIREMCRVAPEARVFPLLELNGSRSRHLDAVTDGLVAEGYDVSIVDVPYEFQRGGNQMLVVRRVDIQ